MERLEDASSINNLAEPIIEAVPGAMAQDRAELVQLGIEQSQLVQLIKTRDVSIKKKIQRLAQIIKRRYELADPSLKIEGFYIQAVQQISTELKRVFKDHPICNNIDHYLDREFKDPSKRNNLLGDRRIAYDDNMGQVLVDLTKYHKEVIASIPQMSRAEMCEVYEMLTQGNDSVKQTLERVATERHLLLPGHEPKIERKTPREEPRYTMQWQEVLAFSETMMRYANFLYTYPGPPEKEPLWAAGWYRFRKFYEHLMNEKLSETDMQWINKIKAMIHQSKHGAAGEDEKQSMICTNCWDDEAGQEVEGTNAEMIFDLDSPTEWRCTSCGGIEGAWKGLTREQVSDNKAPVLTKAEAYIKELPGFYESHIHYVTNPQKRIYGRKILLAPKLRKKA